MDDAGFYATLAVDSTASPADIRRAYHAIAKKLHPDRVGQDEAARLEMAKVGEAWAILRNPALRQAYDEDGREGVDNLSDFEEDEAEGEGAAGATPDDPPTSAELPHNKTHTSGEGIADGASNAARAGASKRRPASDAATGAEGAGTSRSGPRSEHASRTTPKTRPRPKPREPPAVEAATSEASSFGSFLSGLLGGATASPQSVAGSGTPTAAPGATTRAAAPRPDRSTAAAACAAGEISEVEQLSVLSPDAAALVDAVAEAVRRTEERAAKRYERALASLVRELMPGVGEAAAAMRARQAWDGAA